MSGSGGEEDGVRGIKRMKGTYSWDVLKTKHKKNISCNDINNVSRELFTNTVYIFYLIIRISKYYKIKNLKK